MRLGAINAPFDALDCCVTEATDVIIVTVYRPSGSEHQAVSREAKYFKDHHLFP